MSAMRCAVLRYGNDNLFDAYDTNGDGNIDADEFMRGKVPLLGQDEGIEMASGGTVVMRSPVCTRGSGF